MDQPTACTLSPRDYGARTAALRALAARALRAREQIPAGARLTFDAAAITERELRAVIAAEASCCAFLKLELLREQRDLILDVSGPADARPIIEELFA
jgi:hypothetical protein